MFDVISTYAIQTEYTYSNENDAFIAGTLTGALAIEFSRGYALSEASSVSPVIR